MDRGAWGATVHSVIDGQTLLSMHTYLFTPRMFLLSFFAMGTLGSIDHFFLSFLPSSFFFFPSCLVWFAWILVPPPGIRPSPNHWATREFPQLALFFLKLNLLALYFFLDFKGQKKYFSLFVSVQ